MEIRHADLQIEVEEAQDAPAHPVGRHSAELGGGARDAGGTLPGPEPDAPAGESGTSSYGI